MRIALLVIVLPFLGQAQGLHFGTNIASPGQTIYFSAQKAKGALVLPHQSAAPLQAARGERAQRRLSDFVDAERH